MIGAKVSVGNGEAVHARKDEAAREAHGCTAVPGLRELKGSARSLDSAHLTPADC
jgi:hypothetical protein